MRNRDEILREQEAKEIVGELYRKYHGTADGIIESILGLQIDKADREDLIQEGFIKILNHAEGLVGRSEGEQFSYMCSSIRHLAIDTGRKLSRQKQVSITEILDCELLAAMNIYGVSPEDQYVTEEEWSEMSELLRNALKKLTHRDYTLIMERYVNELTDREISRKLGIKEAFVRVYAERACKRAAHHYKEEVDKERARRRKTKEIE